MSNKHMSVGDLSEEECQNILNVQKREQNLSDNPKPPKQKIILLGKKTPSALSMVQACILSGALKDIDVEFQESQEEKAKEYLDQAKIQWKDEQVYEFKNYMGDIFSGKGTPFKRDKPKIGRNQPCPCGSLKKFKHCCLNKKQ